MPESNEPLCGICSRVRSLDDKQLVAALTAGTRLNSSDDYHDRQAGLLLLRSVAPELKRRILSLCNPEVTDAATGD